MYALKKDATREEMIYTEVEEAIQNALENGYPVDQEAVQTLAEDLLDKCDFLDVYTLDEIKMAIMKQRGYWT